MRRPKLFLLDIRESYYLAQLHAVDLELFDDLVSMVFVATVEAAGMTRDSMVYHDRPVLFDPLDVLYECDPIPSSIPEDLASQLLHSLMTDLRVPVTHDDWLVEAQDQPIRVVTDRTTATICIG